MDAKIHIYLSNHRSIYLYTYGHKGLAAFSAGPKCLRLFGSLNPSLRADVRARLSCTSIADKAFA